MNAAATTRRAAMGGILGAGVATALPDAAAAQAPELSAIDNHVIRLWVRWRREDERITGLPTSEDREVAYPATLFPIEDQIENFIPISVLACAAYMLIELERRKGLSDPILELYRTTLRALRPQLDTAIGEFADRVLAEDEEAA